MTPEEREYNERYHTRILAARRDLVKAELCTMAEAQSLDHFTLLAMAEQLWREAARENK